MRKEEKHHKCRIKIRHCNETKQASQKNIQIKALKLISKDNIN